MNLTLGLVLQIMKPLLFGIESFNVVGHFCVLFGIRMLPRKDMTRLRIFFLIGDTFPVLLTTLLFTREYAWGWAVCVPHLVIHVYCFLGWEKWNIPRKVVSWSSLDSYLCISRFSPEFWDMLVGTGVDALQHLILAVTLFVTQDSRSSMFGLLIVALGCMAVLFNPRLAWCHPDRIPKWVQKRIQAFAQ